MFCSIMHARLGVKLILMFHCCKIESLKFQDYWTNTECLFAPLPGWIWYILLIFLGGAAGGLSFKTNGVNCKVLTMAKFQVCKQREVSRPLFLKIGYYSSPLTGLLNSTFSFSKIGLDFGGWGVQAWSKDFSDWLVGPNRGWD